MQEEKPMIVRKLRLERGWSQEDLAQLSGLSVRTIQRIERGKRAGLESLKCLAAVFETDLTDLMQENEMADNKISELTGVNREEGEAIEYVQNLKGFHLNWICFVIVIACLTMLNLYTTPDELWVIYPALGWLLGIVLHGVTLMIMFGGIGVFGAKWERRQIEKRLNDRK